MSGSVNIDLALLRYWIHYSLLYNLCLHLVDKKGPSSVTCITFHSFLIIISVTFCFLFYCNEVEGPIETIL